MSGSLIMMQIALAEPPRQEAKLHALRGAPGALPAHVLDAVHPGT
jgi:hypothetical protein